MRPTPFRSAIVMRNSAVIVATERTPPRHPVKRGNTKSASSAPKIRVGSATSKVCPGSENCARRPISWTPANSVHASSAAMTARKAKPARAAGDHDSERSERAT